MQIKNKTHLNTKASLLYGLTYLGLDQKFFKLEKA